MPLQRMKRESEKTTVRRKNNPGWQLIIWPGFGILQKWRHYSNLPPWGFDSHGGQYENVCTHSCKLHWIRVSAKILFLFLSTYSSTWKVWKCTPSILVRSLTLFNIEGVPVGCWCGGFSSSWSPWVVFLAINNLTLHLWWKRGIGLRCLEGCHASSRREAC